MLLPIASGFMIGAGCFSVAITVRELRINRIRIIDALKGRY
jgi:hypothetical protein